MVPIILNTKFEKLGMIDDYISFIWTARYYKTGDFELCTAINEKTIEFLKKNYYIMREDDDNVGIIEKIRFNRTENESEMMVVTGRFLSSIMGRRIIEKMTEINNLTVPEAIKKLLNENIISPSMAVRKISNFKFLNDTNFNTKITVQYTGKNLLETIENLCETYGLGFKMSFENGQFIFHLFEGIDRSYNQTKNPYIVFSGDYDNLESSEYEEDHQNIVTDVLVAGEGEGLERKTIWASSQVNSGLSRYEVYQDARNSSTNSGEISDAVYFDQLKNEGLENITTYTKAFSGKVFFDNYKYKTDFGIGDIVTIENTNWDIRINTRLIEVIESMSEAGQYTITPTFGV